MMARRYGWIALLLLLLAGCGRTGEFQAQLYVFGTAVDITLHDVPEAKAEQAIRRINADFRRWHHEWHAWEPGPLTAVNAALAEGRPAEALPSLIPLIEQSKRLYRQSEGLFNPAIGRLLRLWGFQANEPPGGPPPDAAAIAELVARDPGMDDIHLRGGRIIATNPAVQLDFGAFAKGYAVDRAIETLREMGIENAIINAGGDLRAIGRKGNRPWRIGIRHPQGEGVMASLEISGDESVYTSGNYERFREHAGVHYMHILDPRTGWPVEGITSVTVLHSNGAVADAAATALVVAGAEAWRRIARGMGIEAAMLVEENGTVHMTTAMAERATFSRPAPREVVVRSLLEE